MADLNHEINRRRTFAIISHPDAGKTTLTEKFLLYGGAIQTAGSVKGKQTDKHAVSNCITDDVTEIPLCFSSSIQSETACLSVCLPFTEPAV